ncbi:MAG: UvrD-helicase domain-containing protein [Anaerolineae bacterium]|nr:UvrD-helicase domain-containing protein [Anaerolineae bacterium]
MTLDEIVGAISSLKAAGLSPEAAAAKALDPHRRALAWCYGVYQKQLKAEGSVDFDDLILQPLLLLSGNLETRSYYQSRYTNLIVDEFQDTSRTQYGIVHLLAEHHCNLTVIGDPNQSVYEFGGAMGAEGFELFRKDFPEATAVYLPHNYRSTPEVVALAETFLTNAKMSNGNGRQVAVRSSGPPVFLYRASSEYQEAQWIAEEIVRAQHAGYIAYDDCAVLARTNAQIQFIEKHLVKSRIPCWIMGEGTFFNHQEVQVIRALMRLSLDFLGDSLALKEALDAFRWIPAELRNRLMGDDPELTSEHLTNSEGLKVLKPDACAVVRQVTERLHTLNDHQGDTPEAFITFVMTDELFGFNKVLKSHTDSDIRFERVRELVRMARQFATLGEFLDDLDTMSGDDPLSLFSAKQVSLSTVHAFKGLERKLIFFAGFEDGFFPLASTTANPQEDLRLAYVGFTRARDALCVSFAQTRGGCRRLSSGWLRGLPMEMRQRPNWPNEVQRCADRELQTQLN